VQLNLPVRLRWRTPFGLTTEVSETLDVCRGGLLIYRAQACEPDLTLWVTFPFDPEMRFTQAEIPARVTRMRTTPSGGHLVAIAFEFLPQPATETPGRRNRRASRRTRLALPLRVRPVGFPWAEETMTIDLSEDGALFGTSRVYQVGDAVRVRLENGPWPGRSRSEEYAAHIVRVSEPPDTLEQRVAICMTPEDDPFR
jgi:hypothetical protein